MCGIVGVISASVTTVQQDKHFKRMLVMDQIRGLDSVGVMASKTGSGRTDFFKSVFDPATFLEMKTTKQVMTGATGLVGHNRAATRGNITPANAHPFNHGPITLVHNGTLSYPMPEGASAFDVDSEAIAFALSKVPPEEATAVLESLNGAYALVWRDDRDSSWNLARNDQRPLHVMTVVGGTSMYISSEAGILYACVNDDITITDIKSQIPELPVGQLHKIQVSAGKLIRGVTPFTPKKQYTPVVSVAKVQSTGGTSNSVQSSPAYTKATNDFHELGIEPGWYAVSLDKVLSQGPGLRMYRSWLNKYPYNEVQISTYEVLDLSKDYDVFIETLYKDSPANKLAKTEYDWVLTTFRVREQDTKKKKPSVEELNGGLSKTCTACGIQQESESDVYHLADGDIICKSCFSLNTDIRDYATLVGITKKPSE